MNPELRQNEVEAGEQCDNRQQDPGQRRRITHLIGSEPITVPVDSDQESVVEAAKANEKVAKAIAGMQIVKVIHVKNKLVNLIVKPC